MLAGLIGKPNAGKSTFFNAATMLSAKTGNYPFTTVTPNIGVAWVTRRCVCRELGVTDNPRNSRCENGIRYVPVKLVDLPGLIRNAWRGEGLGNQFLDEVMKADALIHVVDASGYTGPGGEVLSSPSNDPLNDIEFIEDEIDMWIAGTIRKDVSKISKAASAEEVNEIMASRLSGLGIRAGTIKEVLKEYDVKLREWNDDLLVDFSRKVRKMAKPILVVANKADVISAEENIERIRKSGRPVVPASGEAELLLKKAAEKGVIRYQAGQGSFEVTNPGLLTEQQRRALDTITSIIDKYGSTGVQRAINETYYELLMSIGVYPVEDENRFSDKKGNVLPDTFIVKKGTTARELAYIVHTDLGDGFLYAVDARTKMKLGADYELKDDDIIKIVSTSRMAGKNK